ncbi:YIP1 family protein [candidate division KSB1 bacterium]|nr:YIP1 family protein [candidate division KSB1 bacterium]NIR73356.1 YIP1 family protein [candidate division KSB1 bacterium]NIS25236.1 YIP1 family protein [candidate division KSB1 bacterium]NIT72139.1 YIP1 family protein [candidate division KSB1 bacterium]NIU25945.1 YIP1 family protein [candidate division KSB1 bacterium]
MQQIFERVKKIILNPRDALAEVKTEEIVIGDFMKEYVAIVAAVPAIAQFIGLIGRGNLFSILLFVVLGYVVNLVVVFVFGKVLEALAQTFGGVKNTEDAFKLAAYSYTPYFIAGIFNINPALSILAVLGGLYGIYILYLGVPTLMESPQDKALAYAAVSIIIMIIISFVLGLLVASVAGVGYMAG